MNIIHIVLLVGLVLVAIGKANAYFTLKNTPEEERNQTEFRKARRDFIWYTAVAVVYLCIKLA